MRDFLTARFPDPYVGLDRAEYQGLIPRLVELGISGGAVYDALIATAVGLAAAIPAVVAYNHFLNRLRRMDGEMEGFIEELVQLFETYASNAVPASRGSGSNRMPLTR